MTTTEKSERPNLAATAAYYRVQLRVAQREVGELRKLIVERNAAKAKPTKEKK